MFLRSFCLVTAWTPLRPTNRYRTTWHEEIFLARQLSSSHCGALSVHNLLVFFRSMAWIGSNHIPPSISSHSCSAAHLFPKTILPCFRSIFFHILRADHAHVHRHLQKVPLRPPDAEIPSLDITLPASPLVCINLCFSKISIVHAFHCSLLHLFIHTLSAQKTVATTDKSCVWLWKVHQARQRGVSTQKSVREKISQDVQVVEVVSVALT